MLNLWNLQLQIQKAHNLLFRKEQQIIMHTHIYYKNIVTLATVKSHFTLPY